MRAQYSKRIELLVKECANIRKKYVAQLFYSSSISQNGFIDAMLVLSYSINMVKDIFVLYNGRVTNRDLFNIAKKIYYSIAIAGSVYPVNRLLACQEGYAILAFDITPDGRAENFENIESSHPKFYVHTRLAVAEWKFAPATQDGTSIQVRCRFRQEFRIPYKMRC